MKGTKKTVFVVTAAIIVISSVIVALPQSSNPGPQPSAKVTAKVSELTLIPRTVGTGDWVTILCNNIRTANLKDLFITAALEVGVQNHTEAPPQSDSEAFVDVRVLRDGQPVEPGVIAYTRRDQTLDTTGTDEVDLFVRTLEANSFSFVDADVPVGIHQICVQARIRTEGSGDFTASGAVGRGTVTVESVRMIRGEDVLLQ